MSSKPRRVEILEHAALLTGGDRQATYGPPHDNHINISVLWAAWHKIRTSEVGDAEDVMIKLALLKIARMVAPGATADSYTDAAAYLAMAGEERERARG